MSGSANTPHSTERKLPNILGEARDGLSADETMFSNGKSGTATLTICVPSYKDSAIPLLESLASLKNIDNCSLVLFDDGSDDEAATQKHMEAIAAFPSPARLITSARNFGRSHARNRLVALAEAEWILLLDADMLPDDAQFLTRYIKAVSRAGQPALIAGGFSLAQVSPDLMGRLHAIQAAASDCIPASVRNTDPGRYVFTSNILVHRDILSRVSFDDGFVGWGWEDVDWGFRVTEEFAVHHIENTATHLGLEPDKVLVHKFGTSGQNYARLVEKHPDLTANLPLTRAAKALKPLRFSAPLIRQIALMKFLPKRLRLIALKAYRAMEYSRYMGAS